MRRPIHKIQIEIILQRRRIQHLIRRSRNLSRALDLAGEGTRKGMLDYGPTPNPWHLRLESKNIPARGRKGRGQRRRRAGRRRNPPVQRLRAIEIVKENRPEDGGVGAGSILLPQIRGRGRRGGGRRGRGRRGEVEESKVGSGAAGNESIAIDYSRRRGGRRGGQGASWGFE